MTETYIKVSLKPTSTMADCLDFLERIKKNRLVKDAKMNVLVDVPSLNTSEPTTLSTAQLIQRRDALLKKHPILLGAKEANADHCKVRG
jgi:hypothetical protein